MSGTRGETNGLEIAIVGMACHFPGAASVEDFLENLRQGVESIRFFTDDELRAAGTSAELLRRPSYVKAGAVLDGIFDFDAGYFGYTPREAEIIDPQQRLFLERAAEALERAGHDPERFPGSIGVYAGVTNSSYAPFLQGHPGLAGVVDGFQILVANDRDFLASRVAYKLGLQGPAVVVQTACSTSLAAVHLACQALLAGDCDLALAGGASVRVPQTSGYFFQEEGIASPDGHCRPFDARARGTVPGNGVGVVVLRRLADALASGDSIAAVIRGSAINNDGAQRLGFTAPRIEGQAAVVRAALGAAEVEPRTIGYLEAHGTATALGDPIEIAALNQVFGGPGRPSCAIGSVKGNFGHLDAAAGVAGLMKAALSLSQGQIFPTLHFERANPKADFGGGPFRVQTALGEFPGPGPRRAGVSSFGMGGTNVHVVLEEAPELAPTTPSEGPHLLVWSARSEPALEAARERLGAHLARRPELDLADVAFTLATGRRRHEHRAALVAESTAEATSRLSAGESPRIVRGRSPGGAPPVAFVFPGQGAAAVGLARGLYEGEPLFRKEFDRCAGLARPLLDRDLGDLFRTEGAGEADGEGRDTAWVQPALFAVEHALARLWMSLGVKPQAMIGHSVGEYVAACLAGVFALEDAIALLVERGRLMAACPPGGMLAVLQGERDLQAALEGGLSLAAVNAPEVCVLAGPRETVERWRRRFEESGVAATVLPVGRAFHSPDMDAALAPFRERVARVTLRAPSLPFVSNVTGTWITAAEARDPAYWASHLRATVRFASGVSELRKENGRVFLEVGPGDTLTGLLRRQLPRDFAPRLVASLPARGGETGSRSFLEAAGRLFVLGAPLEPAARDAGGRRRRLPLPTYPFERRRYVVEPPKRGSSPGPVPPTATPSDPGAWLHLQSWRRLPPAVGVPSAVGGLVLVSADDAALGEALAQRLRARGAEVVVARGADAERVCEGLAQGGRFPGRIVHLGGLEDAPSGGSREPEGLFFDLLRLVKAAGARATGPVTLVVVTAGAQEVTGGERLSPSAAAVLGACAVVPMEYAALRCRAVDLELGDSTGTGGDQPWLDRLALEALADHDERQVALRGTHRWAPQFVPFAVPEGFGRGPRLRDRGVYLVTGGFGGIGLALARHLAETVSARLILVSRRGPAGERSQAAVRQLEARGAEVMAASADVADREAMARVVEEAERRFGAIQGVIHAAGVPGAGLIALTGREPMAAVLAPKIGGTLALHEIFRARPLDFFVLCSSLTGVRGALGQADYAAANAFLDAYAQAAAPRPDRLTCSVAWDTWRESGMAVEASLPASLAARREELLRDGLADAEGVAVFRRVLAAGLPRVLVSKRPLADRFRTAPAREEARAASPPAESPEAVRHARPALGNEYVAPRTDLERTLAEAWQMLLGIDRVGATDNFFELGGESLSALRLVALLQERKGLRLSLVRLYESPTIEGLARHLSGDPEGEAVLEASGRRGGSRAEALAERRQSRQAPPRPRAPGEPE